jgi:hypothetical protein
MDWRDGSSDTVTVLQAWNPKFKPQSHQKKKKERKKEKKTSSIEEDEPPLNRICK